jgi:TetR/AcrR family transcriptional repressor of mexJK operon
MEDMETDPRPMEDILRDFALRFLELISMPTFCSLHRMVVAEARTTPELAETFFEAGPQRTREELGRFFARPDIRAQLRPDLRPELLPVFLLNCIMGDQMSRLLFPIVQRRRSTSCAPARPRGWTCSCAACDAENASAHFCHLFYTDF